MPTHHTGTLEPPPFQEGDRIVYRRPRNGCHTIYTVTKPVWQAAGQYEGWLIWCKAPGINLEIAGAHEFRMALPGERERVDHVWMSAGDRMRASHDLMSPEIRRFANELDGRLEVATSETLQLQAAE